MRLVALSFVALGLAVVAGRAVLAESESADGGWGGWNGAVVKAQTDVVCSLHVPSKSGVVAGATVKARVVVANKGRQTATSVPVAIYADSASGTPLWSGTVTLHGHRRATKQLSITVPAGASTLVAVATCPQDGNPGNNIDTVTVGQSGGEQDGSGDDGGGSSGGDDDGGTGGSTSGGGTSGGTGGTTPTGGTHTASAIAGAATFSANCASCHGALAQGTNRAPRIVGRSAGEILGAVREGDDGMPRFPGLTATDAANIAAFLANPSAATPSQPATSGPATYAGSVQAMLAANCVVCHQGTSAPYGIRLDTYADASANASLALAAMQGQATIPGTTTIDATAMPPGSSPTSTTSQANIAVMQAWIAAGKPQ